MIKGGFLTCPDCGKKIMPIREHDIVSATVYCHNCAKYYRVNIVNGVIGKIREEGLI